MRYTCTYSWFEILSRYTQIAFGRKVQGKGAMVLKKKNFYGKIQFTTFLGEDFTLLYRLLIIRDQRLLLILKDHHIWNNVVCASGFKTRNFQLLPGSSSCVPCIMIILCTKGYLPSSYCMTKESFKVTITLRMRHFMQRTT